MVYQNIFEKENGNIGIGIENPPARLSVKGASFEIQGVTATAGSDVVTGSRTSFTVQVAVGDQITIGEETRIVREITDNTHLKVDSNFTTTTGPPEDMMTVVPDILRVEDSTGKPKLVVSKKGYIGIGTQIPNEKLTISEGDLKIEGGYYRRLKIVSDDYWAGIELVAREKETAGHPHIDFTHGELNNSNFGIRLYAPTNDKFVIQGGNVGIGKISPESELHINDDSAGAQINVDGNGGTYGLYLGADSNHPWLGSRTNHDLRLVTNAEEKIRIQTNGFVGIGTDKPKAKLEVSGGAIMPAAGDSEIAGILFPKDPGGGSGDAAWIRYYPRGGEATTLEIGTSNDKYDHIALMASGNVGIGTDKPKAKLEVSGGAIMPAAGDSEIAGILFPKDPGGGSGDAAWIRYYPRGGEATTLEVGTSNDKNDHIALMASGNVGIGTLDPGAKLDVNGGAYLGYETTVSNFGEMLKSGFYQNGGQKITGDVPDDSHHWTHLITARHSNTNNNYQLQIAASYRNNNQLFFRKIQANGISNPQWHEIATRDSNTFSGDQVINGNVNIKKGLTSGDKKLVPIYRFYASYSGDHFYTRNKKEGDRAAGYKYEGIAFYAFH